MGWRGGCLPWKNCGEKRWEERVVVIMGTGKLMFEEKVLISITFHHCISQFLNVAKTHLCSQMYIVMHQCTH